MADNEPLRVLIIGPTGSGKSSTANTILMAAEGQEKMLFKVGGMAGSLTRHNQRHTRTVLGRRITIVDTPGADNSSDKPETILKEIRAAIEESCDDYDAILYVVDVFRYGLLFNDLTLRVFEMAEKALGKEFWNHVVFVFTHKENFFRLQKLESGGGQYQVFPFEEYIDKDKLTKHRHAIGPYVKVQGAAAIVENLPTQEEKLRSDMVEQVIKAIEKVKARNPQGFNKTMLTNSPEYPENSEEEEEEGENNTHSVEKAVIVITALLGLMVAILVAFFIKLEK